MKNKKINKMSQNEQNFLLRFVTSYSMILVFILLMGLCLYQYGIHDAKANLKRQSEIVLHNAANDFESSLDIMSTFVTQLSNNTAIRQLMNADQKNSPDFRLEALDVMRLLTDFIPLEDAMPIQDYFIYLPNSDYVISSRMLSDIQRFYHHNKLSDASLYEDWHSLIASGDNMKQFIPLGQYYPRESNSFLYKIPLSTSVFSSKKVAFVCFEISVDELSSIFQNLSMFETGFLMVTDHQGQQLFCFPGEETKTASMEAFKKQLYTLPLSMSQAYTSIRLNGESFYTTMVNSSDTMYHYYLVQPSEFVFHDLNTYQSAYGLVILLTCSFCLVMIYLLSKKNVKPIMKIHSDLESSIHKTNTLMEELEDQKPIIYHSYIGKIIRGQIYSETEEHTIQQFLGLNQEHGKYCVLYLSAYKNRVEFFQEQIHEKEISKESANDYRNIIRSYINEYFKNQVLVYEVDINSFALLITTSEELSPEEANTYIHHIFLNMQNALANEKELWIFGGLGNRNTRLSYLWKSYQQANEAFSSLQEGNVFQAFSDIKRNKFSYYYPFEMAQQLSNFIQSGNNKQVTEIFRLIKKENFVDVALPVQLQKWLLSDIRNTLLRVRFGITLDDINAPVLEYVDAAFQQDKTIELLEEVSIKLCSLNQNKPEGNRLILSIKDYIKENYSDPSLSLKKISDVFDISESYFSYLFKAETKQNFSEYLELIRMDQAMIILKTTDINVSNMYLELGYNNANSFRRAFKKIHGVSPKAIRESIASEGSVEEPDVT